MRCAKDGPLLSRSLGTLTSSKDFSFSDACFATGNASFSDASFRLELVSIGDFAISLFEDDEVLELFPAPLAMDATACSPSTVASEFATEGLREPEAGVDAPDMLDLVLQSDSVDQWKRESRCQRTMRWRTSGYEGLLSGFYKRPV